MNKFKINTQTFGPEYKKHIVHTNTNIYTDGSKTKTGTGAGFVIYDKHNLIQKDYIPLSPTATIFQAEIIAIKRLHNF